MTATNNYDTDAVPLSAKELHALSRMMLRGALDVYLGIDSRDCETRHKMMYSIGRIDGERALERGDSLWQMARHWWRNDRHPLPERHARNFFISVCDGGEGSG